MICYIIFILFLSSSSFLFYLFWFGFLLQSISDGYLCLCSLYFSSIFHKYFREHCLKFLFTTSVKRLISYCTPLLVSELPNNSLNELKYSYLGRKCYLQFYYKIGDFPLRTWYGRISEIMKRKRNAYVCITFSEKVFMEKSLNIGFFSVSLFCHVESHLQYFILWQIKARR